MALPAQDLPFTALEYLAWEAEQPEKHEYLGGEIFAMGGAARNHVTVSLNLASAVADCLEGTPCRVYMADMKVEVAAANAFFYPDVFVTCDPEDHRADLVMRAPTMIAEILSPSTAAFDRGGKFQIYRLIPNLREYALIDPERGSIELFRREPDGRWFLVDIARNAPLPLTSLGLEIPWARIFRNGDAPAA